MRFEEKNRNGWRSNEEPKEKRERKMEKTRGRRKEAALRPSYKLMATSDHRTTYNYQATLHPLDTTTTRHHRH
jgi:hypothetical protein